MKAPITTQFEFAKKYAQPVVAPDKIEKVEKVAAKRGRKPGPKKEVSNPGMTIERRDILVEFP